MRTIRRSVYIGLGGAGIKAIAHTKKMYEDVFGEGNIPPQIAFVAIDNDLAIIGDPSLPTSMEEHFVPLPVHLCPCDQYAILKAKGMFNWMFPENETHIPPTFGVGACQVRTSGRLLTEMNVLNIQSRIDSAMMQVKSMMPFDDKYSIDSGPVDVHIAMSLAGGTGSGSFVNVAQCIRERYGERVNILGYGVLHSVFRAMDPSLTMTPRVRLNSYSAVMDLDYLQSATPLNPIALQVNGTTKIISLPLFDNVYLIDNKNDAGQRVDNLNHLSQSLGLYMFHSGSEIGCVDRTFHAADDWKWGYYNWENKLAWVQRPGVCHVVYKGDLLAELYALKAKYELIRQLKSPQALVESEVVGWTETLGIREKGDEYCMLVDRILSPEEMRMLATPRLTIDESYEDMCSNLRMHHARCQMFPTDEKIQSLREEIGAALKTKVAEILNATGGVDDAQRFLEKFNEICSRYIGAVEIRCKRHVNSCLEKENALFQSCLEYKHCPRSLFKTCSRRQNHIDALTECAMMVLKATLEVNRHERALRILATIIDESKKALANVMTLRASLNALGETCSNKILDMQCRRWGNLFEYDLSANERLNLTLGQHEVSLVDFTASLQKPLSELTKEEMDAALDAFTASLPRCEEYRTKLIEDVIEELSEAEYKKLKYEATRKASPLLALEERFLLNPLTGVGPERRMSRRYTVLIYKDDLEKKSRLENDSDLFYRDVHACFIPSDAPEMKQKVVFSCFDSAVIPYFVDAFDESVEFEYQSLLSTEDRTFNPHIDLQIYEEMKKRDFRLKPVTNDEAMFYWVAGQIFGWTEIVEYARIMEKGPNGETLKELDKAEVTHEKYIRFDKYRYWYWDEKDPSRGQTGKWAEAPSSNRQRAFKFFKTVVLNRLRDEFKKLILANRDSRGTGYYETLIDELKTNGKQDYIDKVMCSDESSVTYYGIKVNSLETKFVDDEWAYLDEKFMDALQLLK